MAAHNAILLTVLLIATKASGGPRIAREASSESGCGEHQCPIIHTCLGVVQGQVVTPRDTAVPYAKYQGIPYAKPPIGPLRFKDPEPAEPWEGIRNCRNPRHDCPQALHPLAENVVRGNEDCLYLNVYTPHPHPATPKSVMVWIHGGAFTSGSGGPMFYSPDYLIARDVVVVTLNYRLGTLGFLSLGTDEVSGNQGLLDQVQALRWVKECIPSFGGDPNNVTIFGESAGAASVHMHTLSPLSKGLFQAAILQSGAATNPWAFKLPESALLNTAKLLNHVNCSNTDAPLACLQKVSPAQLTVPSSRFKTKEDNEQMNMIPFPPTVDGKFLTAPPSQLLDNAARVPVMSGFTDREGFICLPLLHRAGGKEQWQRALDNGVAMPLPEPPPADSPEHAAIAAAVRRCFFNDNPISEENVLGLVDLCTDWFFIEGGRRSLESRLNMENAPPQYVYQFSFDGKLNFAKKLFQGKGKGASHADDLSYIFKNNFVPQPEDIDDEIKVRNRFTQMVTNFAKHGDPTPEVNELLTVKWEPYTKERPVHIDINRELTIIHSPLAPHRGGFWTNCARGNYSCFTP